MADKKDSDFSTVYGLDREWIIQALKTQRNVVSRSMTRERPGSEVLRIRVREVEEITSILSRLGAV